MSFSKVAESPTIVAPRVLAIASRWEAQQGRLLRWSLHGAYRLSEAQAGAIEAAQMQRALCVTITSGFRFDAFNLVGEQLTYRDDEAREGGWVEGHFNTDLLGRFELELGDRCFVLVSLGPYLSNVVAVQPGDGEGSAGY